MIRMVNARGLLNRYGLVRHRLVKGANYGRQEEANLLTSSVTTEQTKQAMKGSRGFESKIDSSQMAETIIVVSMDIKG